MYKRGSCRLGVQDTTCNVTDSSPAWPQTFIAYHGPSLSLLISCKLYCLKGQKCTKDTDTNIKSAAALLSLTYYNINMRRLENMSN